MITEEKFKQATGRDPENDDMHRVNCDKAGQAFHMQCGWCHDCDNPKFGCECSSGNVVFDEPETGYSYTILTDGFWACHICKSEHKIGESCYCGNVNPWEGTCEVCNKVKRVCREDGCNGAIAKNATTDDKCGQFVKIEPLKPREVWRHQLVDKINELVDAVNELTKMCKDLSKEQSK